MTARLPIPGKDDGTWGSILNSFLDVSHNANGSLKGSAVQAAGAVTKVNGRSPISGSVSVGVGDLSDAAVSLPINNQVLTYNGGTGKWVNQSSAGGVTLDTTASDIRPLGTQAAGSVGEAADAGHVHAMPQLDQVSNPTTNVSLNSHKITNLSNGTVSTDAAAFGQIPASLPPSGTAGGDLGGSYPNPTVTATHLSAGLPINQGGTGQVTQQAALDALAGAVTSGSVLRGNGTHVTISAIQAGDVPTLNQNTTGTAANITDTLDQIPAPAANVSLNSHKITGLANGMASSDAAAFGQIPSASSPLSIGSGGTGQTTQQAALDTLAGSVTSGHVLRGDGSHATMSALQASDIPNITESQVTNLTTDLAAKANLAGGTYTGYFAPAVVSLTDATTIAVNAAAGNIFRVTLGGNRTISNPASPIDGQTIKFEITQDATGSRTLTWGSAYFFPTSVPQPTLSTTAGDTDMVVFEYHSTTSQWWCIGYVPQQYSESGVGTLSAGDASIVVGGTMSAPTIEAATLNTIATLHPAAADWSNNSHKITSIANGTAASDVAAFGQIPVVDSTISDIAPNGTQAAGSIGKWADAGHVHPALFGTIPSDLGLLAWSMNIDSAISSVATVAGTVYLAKIPIRYSLTATYLWFNVTSAGSGASSGSFCGLYNSSGTLLSGSSDIGASLTSTGNKQFALTTPQALTAGIFVWAVIVTNLATTQPSLRTSTGGTGASSPNMNLTASTYRFAINGTAQTSLPSSITPSSNGQSGSLDIFVGVS